MSWALKSKALQLFLTEKALNHTMLHSSGIGTHQYRSSCRCQDTMIGGSFVRGVSGGERRRVCIGNEILINPSLLFLDEPTSGLDSTTALRIVQILHEIAEVYAHIYIYIYIYIYFFPWLISSNIE